MLPYKPDIIKALQKKSNLYDLIYIVKVAIWLLAMGFAPV
ncbi:hypothetical protein DI53_2723 [Sphingobacterium deserti]|uniref:Uncharacterized protein n=1 Tax=Sphingobacterium deserti TaxID=1229276 RepID=A0A0B8T783_9SPHI|nr:hypothetical protein DI53_2723 [Sphingobacterium deserti]